MLIEPLHVATIRGLQLRFYRTPNDDGRPDFPWHNVAQGSPHFLWGRGNKRIVDAELLCEKNRGRGIRWETSA